ncbi:DAHP synthetase [Ramicandelaber brevisporus]|nr:DAHP synthetase [Ramicandelaber brevisporus]
MDNASTPATPATSAQTAAWTPTSWTTKPIKQDVNYEDPVALKTVLDKLGRLPPLVVPGEVQRLREQLRDVALGNAFLLQGGDCAELFDYCSAEPIANKLKVMLQMSMAIIWGARMPVVRIARIAGQYAKPRSSPYETLPTGEQVLSFRGDNVNGYEVTDRKPDPDRLLGAYFHSATTLNYIRALLNAGFADLHHPKAWDLGHVRRPDLRKEYQTVVNRILDALDFLRTIGVDTSSTTGSSSGGKAGDKVSSSNARNPPFAPASSLNTVDIYTSHEGLLLDYETALTREMPSAPSCPAAQPPSPSPSGTSTPSNIVPHEDAPAEKSYYNTGAHFLWIGDRTRQLDGAHIEYFRGITNPIGVKVGPSMQPEELVRLLDILNPNHEVGKVTLITRYGASKIDAHLPDHIKAVQKTKHVVVWCCDPMHGNTFTAPGDARLKTRDFDAIMTEISKAFAIHRANGSRLNGVHLELTGDSVTECVGGSMELEPAQLEHNYQTHCDPRLNYEQSLDVAFLIARYYEKERKGLPLYI